MPQRSSTPEGLDDILIGVTSGTLNGIPDTGKAYVVYGKRTTETVNLSQVAAGNGGFVILGDNEEDQLGAHVTDHGGDTGETVVTVNINDVTTITIPANVTFTQTQEVAALIQQDFSLKINKVAATMTLKDGTTQFTWNMGEPFTLTVPPSADVNGDGQVAYTIDLVIDATFTNNTSVGISFTLYTDLGQVDARFYTGGDLETPAVTHTFMCLVDQDLILDQFSDPAPFVFQLGGFNTPTLNGFIDLGPQP